jgi:hypothetical protein
MQAVKIHGRGSLTISTCATGACEAIVPKGKASGKYSHLLPLIPAGCYAPTDNKKITVNPWKILQGPCDNRGFRLAGASAIHLDRG